MMASQVIVSRSSTSTITLILPLYSSKEPTFTTFHYPFRYKVYTLLPINSHTRRFGLSVSSRRCPSSFHESYRMGRTSASTSLIPQLVQALIPPQHDASAGVQSSSGALKHLALKSKSEMFSCVLPINLHILRDAFEGISQPAVLSSIRSPTLDSIWYHAPWLLGYMRRR